MKLAITGATGFVGSHLIDAALREGHSVRALARRPQGTRAGLEWIMGALSDAAALEQLIEATDAVIHVAGVINARQEAEFHAGNVEGTLAMLAAATAGGTRRFVHVSSLAAREPEISLYGRSKARAEALVEGSGLDWIIVRPPAVYGPGDKETLELFRMAKAGLVLLPPRGRLSLVHVTDLARLLLACAGPEAPAGTTYEPDDGRPHGWSHAEFARALAAAVGKRGVKLAMPAPLVKFGAVLDQIIRRDGARLTKDRAAYFCHPDWVVDPASAVPDGLWTPQIRTEKGLASTASWYAAHGWL